MILPCIIVVRKQLKMVTPDLAIPSCFVPIRKTDFLSQSNRVFYNYTKLAVLAIEVGESKINSAKTYHWWGLNLRPIMFYSDAYATELT